MVGWVKYGLDCWMIEEEGKCRAEAEARGLPEKRSGTGKEGRRRSERRRRKKTKFGKNTMRFRLS